MLNRWYYRCHVTQPLHITRRGQRPPAQALWSISAVTLGQLIELVTDTSDRKLVSHNETTPAAALAPNRLLGLRTVHGSVSFWRHLPSLCAMIKDVYVDHATNCVAVALFAARSNG